MTGRASDKWRKLMDVISFKFRSELTWTTLTRNYYKCEKSFCWRTANCVFLSKAKPRFLSSCFPSPILFEMRWRVLMTSVNLKIRLKVKVTRWSNKFVFHMDGCVVPKEMTSDHFHAAIYCQKIISFKYTLMHHRTCSSYLSSYATLKNRL